MGTIATNTVGNCSSGFFPPCICASLRGISPPPKSPEPAVISFMLSDVPNGKYLTCTLGFSLLYCSVHAAYNGLGTFDPDPTSEILFCASRGATLITVHNATCKETRALRSGT